MYREAAAEGMSLQAYINTRYPTQNAQRDGSTWQQVLASEGIFVKPNREMGIRPTLMSHILEGGIQAGPVVKDGVPTSRILFPAVIMSLIEDKLVSNLDMTASAFDKLVAIDETINGERYEQPVINYTKPESARSMATAQLADPPSMMTITTSDKAYKIPSWAIGLEVSDQALKSTSLDFVAMSIARQAAVERNERAQNYVLALLNGDVDNGEASLATLGYSVNSSSLDALCVNNNNYITQKAWMLYLMRNGTKRTLTHLVTDISTALFIEGRSGKPTINNDDSKTSRFDTQFNVMNPTWAKNPDLFITDISAWPANTVMGLDKNWAVRRVRNLAASYQAIEAYVIRRSTAMRFDFGEHVNRLYPEAYQVMVLA
jgi:hypothetical protein